MREPVAFGGSDLNLHYEGKSIDDLLWATYRHIIENGQAVESTKGKSYETMGASLILREPRNRISRSETRYKYVTPLAELCWYLSGSNETAAISHYLGVYNTYDESGVIHGGYGPRLFGSDDNRQVRNAIDQLRQQPSSRRVVLQILDKADMVGERHEDIPCTSTIQFLVRDRAVHQIVSMRSNDARLGLIHDIFAFTMIQEMVARDLGLEVGTYTHFVGSLHLYEDDLDQAREFLDEGLQATQIPMDPMPQGAPWQGIKELLSAELASRSGTPLDKIHIPAEPYWADLARVLVSHNFRRAGSVAEADALRGAIKMQPIRELLDRRKVRGRD